MALSDYDWGMYYNDGTCRMHLLKRRNYEPNREGASFGFVKQSPWGSSTAPTFTVHINFSSEPPGGQGCSVPTLAAGMEMIEALCRNVEGE